MRIIIMRWPKNHYFLKSFLKKTQLIQVLIPSLHNLTLKEIPEDLQNLQCINLIKIKVKKNII